MPPFAKKPTGAHAAAIMKHPRMLALAALLLLAPRDALAWSKTGHNATAAIAGANLTPEARAAIDKYLGGRSIVSVALWMDENYAQTKNWHGAPVDDKFRYNDTLTIEGGDAITAVEQAIRALRDGKHKTLPAKTVEFYIKILVHTLGDMHCPGHVKYTTIKTKFNVTVNGNKVTYHSVWDRDAVDNSRSRDPGEWVQRFGTLDKDKAAEITAGGPRDWFDETAKDSRVIYEWGKPDMQFEGAAWRDFLKKATPLAEAQIQKAGHRLARVCNECFAP